MIVGHYAAALLPWSRLKERGHPFWLLLLCANVPEFLWHALAVAGLEAPQPASLLDASFSSIRVDMAWSHDLVPGLVQAVVVAAAVSLAWRARGLAVACGALVFLHVLCDYVVGFEHHLFGPGTAVVSLDTYGRAPRLALAIEMAFSLACVAWYAAAERRRGRVVPRRALYALVATFTLGTLAWLPAAEVPLRARLSALRKP